ncbi:MAG: flagellar assembly protein FliW [Deltaproteobacteria bacterium]|nr:flagellar assembly protein FliW [Deltaproteobacteria bacterium]
MKIRTTRFGEIDVEENRIVTFTEGILGFSNNLKFVLLDHEANSPFRWLQSAESPELAFVLIDPMMIVPQYRAEIHAEEIAALKLDSLEKATVMCIVNIAKGCAAVTANLLGPVIFNFELMLARQVVLSNSSYSIKHEIMQPSGTTPESSPKENVQG